MGIWICRPRAQGRDVRESSEEKRAGGEMREWPVRWGGEVFQGRECFREKRRVVIVSNTEESSNQTGFVWLLDLVRGRLFLKKNEKRGRLLKTWTREISAGGGDKSN